MLAQAKAEIPELKAANEDFFADLEAARTRGQSEIAVERYKRRLDDLRARGIIAEAQYNTLRLVIPMRVDFAWAKKTGEIGPRPAKTPGEWAAEKGYLKEAQEVGLWDILRFFPEALKETFVERIRELAELPKLPKWVWALLALGALGVAGSLAVTVITRGR